MSTTRTQVIIVGGGPSGLMLSHILQRESVDSIVLERSSREHVRQRIRAGMLEDGTVWMRPAISHPPTARSVLRCPLPHDSLSVMPSPSSRPAASRLIASRPAPAGPRRRLLLAGAAAPLAACRPARPPRTGSTTLVFKHAKLFGDPAPLRRLLDAFEARHPGVRVRDETLPSSSDAQHQFYAINLQARSDAFDVFAADVIWVAGFARAGWLRDLSEWQPRAARQEFFAGPMQAVTWRERVYALPWYVDAGLLYYRRDLLERHHREPPDTWQSLVETAQAITGGAPDLYGFVWQGRQYEGLVCNALEYLWSHGARVLDQGAVVLDSRAGREALQFMVDLVHRYRVTPGSVTTATEEPCRHMFGQGRAVFMRNWPYAWNLYRDPASRVHGAVGITVLPHFPGAASAATLGGWQLAVNAHSRAPEAAAALVQWLGSAPAQRTLALAYGFQPTRIALYEDAELAAAQPQLARLRDVFASARPRPVTPHYVRISQVLQAEFSAALTRLKSPAEALASAQHALERILSRVG